MGAVGLAAAALAPMAAAAPGGGNGNGNGGAKTAFLYNSVPTPLKGNMVSLGYEATSTFEFGDQIRLAPGSNRTLTAATVTMSSWGCVQGSWVGGDCVTPSGATFNHPITLTLYSTDLQVITSVTQTFAIPYRPSASPRCNGDQAGKWYDSSLKTCFNGLATNITFTLPNVALTADEIVYGISYNTSHYGTNPITDSSACPTGGCGYDSLNVGLVTTTLVGSDVDPNSAWLNSTWTGNYCDGGAGGSGTFRPDAGCWEGYTPAFQLKGI